MSTLRLLIKPTLFTAGVCGTCFCGAAIYQYENRKRPITSLHDWVTVQQQRHQQQRSAFNQKLFKFRQDVNGWYNQFRTGEKIAGWTIFLNTVVFCAWRVRPLSAVMSRFFASQPLAPKIPLSPMILSCFSHVMPLHLALNMYALYSFSNFANSLLGPEQLVGLFISAGVVSSLTSLAFRLAIKQPMPSLGASGAILGVIAYVCVARPNAELLLLFIPVSAGTAIKALMTLDFVGMVARWRMLDHAAHFGGSLFGIWYATQGEKLFHQHKRDVVNQWIQLKKRTSID